MIKAAIGAAMVAEAENTLKKNSYLRDPKIIKEDKNITVRGLNSGKIFLSSR